MSEIFILHLDNADEDLYTKILKVINESGHSLQRISAGSGMPLQFKDLKFYRTGIRYFKVAGKLP